jgi:hypothetical protein
MMADLAALTPPFIVCAAFVIGLVALLRHQMAPKQHTNRKDRSHDPE